MARLVPYPLALLCHRMFHELEHDGAIFDLPRSSFYSELSGKDLSVHSQGHVAASPLGPAAGPHTQMAQNLVLSWLAGGRILELKTVQILDQLTIPRPCIDMRTVGFNAEWSQELTLEESLAEYVKGMMLIELLRASRRVPAAAAPLYDLSVGYDFAGISSKRVGAFIAGMRDAKVEIERLRSELPRELGALRDLDFPTALSDNITLSTFHGCPPDEIERIVDFLLRELGLNCVIKLNPMLLGKEETRRLLHDVLGYTTLTAPDVSFDRDLTWDQATGMVERLGATATACGLRLGVKFSNTLVVENDASFLPAEAKEIYLSGPPLHVLAMHLVARFREHFGDRFPISFSAGIDRHNCADAAALGLVPITICTDLLRAGGYGRLPAYYRELGARMDQAGARTLDEFVVRAYGQGGAALAQCAPGIPASAAQRCREALDSGADLASAAGEAHFAAWVSAARVANARHYVASLDQSAHDPSSRYSRAQNLRPPRKIGRSLRLLDCVSCDKCVPVCPNDAVFTYEIAREPLPVVELSRRPAAAGAGATVEGAAGWEWHERALTAVNEARQWATFADFCNECGNCDVFCPEDGGPYQVKARFFGSRASWEQARPLDGFYVERAGGRDQVLGRISGAEYRLESAGGRVEFSGPDLTAQWRRDDPAGSVVARGPDVIDLTWAMLLDRIRAGLLDRGGVNYVNAHARGALA